MSAGFYLLFIWIPWFLAPSQFIKHRLPWIFLEHSALDVALPF